MNLRNKVGHTTAQVLAPLGIAQFCTLNLLPSIEAQGPPGVDRETLLEGEYPLHQ